MQGDAVAVDVEPGDRARVDLAVPGWRAAGVGVQVAPRPDGSEVTYTVVRDDEEVEVTRVRAPIDATP